MEKKEKSKDKSLDTGLRGRFNGELYVDKKVFFNRDDVKRVLKSLKNSETLKEHISQSRKELLKA